MYMKDLKKSIHLRVSEDDMQFLIELSKIVDKSIAGVLRDILREIKYAYRVGLKYREDIFEGSIVYNNSDFN